MAANSEPKHQSTTNMREENDPLTTNPLSDHLSIDGVDGFFETISNRYFQADFSAFMSLVRASYFAHSAFDKGFRKYVSFGMYQYYCVILLWRRLMYVLCGTCATTEHSLYPYQVAQNLYLSFELPVPTDVAMYLNSVGHVTDYSGRTFQLILQSYFTPHREHEAQGTYGRVDEKSAILYETLPSPYVALEKMRQDLLYTLRSRTINADWDLPVDMRPENAKGALPNVNLLGWMRSETLTHEQRLAYADAGIDENGFGVKNVGRLPINQMLMKYVASIIENSSCKATSPLSTSTKGSLAQIPYAARTTDKEIEHTRGLGSKTLQSVCYSPTMNKIALGAATFRFRIQRRSAANEVDTLCYRFAVPPEAWLANENRVFNSGDVHLWNVENGDYYIIPEQDGTSLHTNLAMRVRRQVSGD